MSLFPDPRSASPEGLVAVGGVLRSDVLLEAYQHGIFPWPQEKVPLLWFSPDPRGVLDFTDFHIPQSLKKIAKKRSDLRFSFNEGTSEVIEKCQAQPRKNQDGTWILPAMVNAYKKLAKEGHLLSVEAWKGDELVGGIYGVFYVSRLKQKVFSGESMFHSETGVSKLCLWKLVEFLKQKNISWIDTQMVTDVVKLMGGKYISREEFLQRLGV